MLSAYASLSEAAKTGPPQGLPDDGEESLLDPETQHRLLLLMDGIAQQMVRGHIRLIVLKGLAVQISVLHSSAFVALVSH